MIQTIDLKTRKILHKVHVNRIKNKKGYYNFKELLVNQFCWSCIKSNNINYPIVLFWKKPIVIGENSIGFIFKSLLDLNKFMKNL